MAGGWTSKDCYYVGPIASILGRDYKVRLGSRNGEVDKTATYIGVSTAESLFWCIAAQSNSGIIPVCFGV